MNRFNRFLLIAVVFSLSASQLDAAQKAKQAPVKETAPEVETLIPAAEADYALSRVYRYKMNFVLGLGVIRGSALVTGAQFGFSPFKTPFYVGPEINFALFSPGSIFSTLVGGWYVMRIEGAPTLGLSLGLSAGPAFPSFVPELSSTALAVFGDATISQDVDDLVTIRGQFRPGMVGRFFSFMMAFNLCFRFA